MLDGCSLVLAVVSILSVSSRLLAEAISDPTVTFRLEVWEMSDALSSGTATVMVPCSTYLRVWEDESRSSTCTEIKAS